MPGPPKKPALAVVREGNPSHRPVPDQVAVPPADFAEPDWSKSFPEVVPGKRPARLQRKPDEPLDEWAFRVQLNEGRVAAWKRMVTASESSEFSRRRAAEEWRRIVPVLKASVGLGNCDFSVVVDLCVCIARLEWCEHQITTEGLVVMGQRGPCRNPLTTVVSGYRAQFKTYIRELGLSPSARTGVPSRQEGSDNENPFADEVGTG